ncbi:NADP-dependent oxidoreductase [Halieaceae bacterium IMCC14734]|uniref:NADP-dependent oxidoreductase n=1 Tax=Candidatus Litorirhabdus singularis TaxID=2518993 RepID=A0ABT3THD4_9GAMM|nr:NADP-dependent oxidoreductase [Candidatus Litorirhabdus singularis]MCX2981684.1 NADP-dependent oxidoreductase [Candidatus Litorirhabdus singularis]
MTSNRQWLLKERPSGMVGPEHFSLQESALPEPDLDRGEVLIKTLYLGFDPAMRGWLIDEPSYLPPVQIGEVMRASSVGEVVSSSNPDLPPGTLIQGMAGWQEYSIAGPDSFIPPQPLPAGLTPAMALSVFGTTTLTAYFGLLDICEPQPGDTVLVSGAAGATGSAVAQIARIKGCRVIGIAGGAEKCAWLLDTCRLDAVIDYKSENIDQRLAELCPDGINVFFDNVGGDTLEAAITHMADFGRIALCGGISGYNDVEPAPGPRNLMILVQRRIKMQGFIVIDYMDRFEAAMGEIAEWVMAGEIAWREDIQHGFDNIPATFQRLFSGQNTGKQLLALAEPGA